MPYRAFEFVCSSGRCRSAHDVAPRMLVPRLYDGVPCFSRKDPHRDDRITKDDWRCFRQDRGRSLRASPDRNRRHGPARGKSANETRPLNTKGDPVKLPKFLFVGLVAVAMAAPAIAREHRKSWHDRNGTTVDSSRIVRIGGRHCIRAPDIGAYATEPYQKPPCEPAWRY
jgi:hypothetical protein